MPTVGYYDMSLGQGGSYQVDELTGNGYTAVNITVPNATQLAGIDTLYVTNPSNTSNGAEYLANMTAIRNAVAGGMNLVIFDRYVTGAKTILPGGTSITNVRETSSAANDINLAAGAPSAFTAGINNSTFDGGNLSSHGYVTLGSLPAGATPLLTRANGNQVVAFTYPYGSGTVFYSTIPLDYYSQTNNSAITPSEILSLLHNTVDVLCFANGTLIDTAKGPVAVEHLCIGDMIQVLGGSYEPLRWIGRTVVTRPQMRRSPNLAPVRISAGAMGVGLPIRDLWVSRQHRVMVSSGPLRNLTGEPAALVAACKLVNLSGIDLDESIEEVIYFHLLFDRHQIVWAEGLPTESLFMGKQTDKTLTELQYQEIEALFPHLSVKDQIAPPALPIISGKTRKAFVKRHLRSLRPLIETLPKHLVAVQRHANQPTHPVLHADTLRRKPRFLLAAERQAEIATTYAGFTSAKATRRSATATLQARAMH